jgi:hypothetical protein
LFKLERYKIIRNYRYGNELNVYKAYKVDNNKSTTVPHVVKYYKTREAFEIESQILELLKNSKVIYFYACSFRNSEK